MRLASRLSWVLACAGLCGCVLSSDDAAPPRLNANAGLYTPGSRLGASDPSDLQPMNRAPGERCVALGAGDGAADAESDGEDASVDTDAPGMLEVEYQTVSLGGRYAPKNCTAVWIETVDGRYVATLELTAGLRRMGLFYFQEHACTTELGPDVMTSATRRDHEKAHSATWSGVDFAGNPVPDGPYRLLIEVTESDKEPGELSSFDFDKGVPGRIDGLVTDGGPLQSVTLEWVQESP